MFLEGCWEYRTIVQPSIRRDLAAPPSSAGIFDELPLELLHTIFSNLDLLTLSNLSYTCIRGRVLVESFPAYRDLVTHATSSIAALRRIGLITLHSTTTVHDALLHARCCVCRDFAPFLYMPTCERCCLNCLYMERSLRMMSVSNAQVCFGLTPRDMQNAPKLLKVPGTYGSPSCIFDKRSWLVSAKHALAAALLKYGDRDTMERAVQEADARKQVQYHQKRAAQTLAHPNASRSIGRPRLASWILTDPNDKYRLIGSTPIPWVSNSNDVQKGVWCFGCHCSLLSFMRHEVRLGQKDSYQDGDEARNKILRRARRAFTRTEFLEHVWSCSGAKRWSPNT